MECDNTLPDCHKWPILGSQSPLRSKNVQPDITLYMAPASCQCIISGNWWLDCIYISFPSFVLGAGTRLCLFLRTSTRKMIVPSNRPASWTIIIMPNCSRMSGSLLLTFGSGMSLGGLIMPLFILSRAPVSPSHIIECLNFSF